MHFKLSNVVLIYFIFALFSVSINKIINLEDKGFSISQIFVLLILIIAVFSFKLLLPISKRMIFPYSAIIFFALLSQIHHGGAAKYLFYWIFTLSLILILGKKSIDILKNKLSFIILSVAILGIFMSFLHIAKGGIQIDLSQQLMLSKQEYTVIFTLACGHFFYLFKSNHISVNNQLISIKISVLVTCIAVLLIGIKTMLISIIGLVLYDYLIKKEYKKIMQLGIALTFVLTIAYIVKDYLPSQISAFFYYYAGEANILSVDTYRYLDTLIVREHIINMNFLELVKSPLNFLLGYGFNPVEGTIFKSEVTWYQQEFNGAYESGFLYILAISGVLGLAAFLIFTVTIALKKNSWSAYIFIALLFSNISQDNVNSLLWFFIGLMWWESSKAHEKQTQLISVKKGSGFVIHNR